MREYGQVQCAFWQAARAQEWSQNATHLGAYLLTSPHSNGIGCYVLLDGYVASDLGWDSETVAKAFAELSRNGFAYRYGTVVLLPKFLRWNRIANGNVAKARQFEWESLPSGEGKDRCALYLKELGNHWAKGFETVLQTVSETISKRFAKQNPTQPNPENKSSSAESAPPPTAPPVVPTLAVVGGSDLKLQKPVIELPTNTGKPWAVYAEMVAEWEKLFPAVDVLQQLRAMRAWSDANPRKRKTASGMRRFIVAWLTKDQNAGGSRGPTGNVPRGTSGSADTAAAWAAFLDSIRNQALAIDPTVARITRELGGLDRLGSMTRFDIDRLRHQFDALYREQPGVAHHG